MAHGSQWSPAVPYGSVDGANRWETARRQAVGDPAQVDPGGAQVFFVESNHCPGRSRILGEIEGVPIRIAWVGMVGGAEFAVNCHASDGLPCVVGAACACAALLKRRGWSTGVRRTACEALSVAYFASCRAQHRQSVMEEALQKLDEQLDKPESSLIGGSLSDDAKKELLPLVVEVARCYIQEERSTKFIEKGLEWSRVALSIDSDHEHAKLLETDAIDKLDNKLVRPQPLGFAIDQLKSLLEERKDEYGQKAAAILNLKKEVKKDVLYDTAFAQVVSLRARYCQQIQELISSKVKVHYAHEEKGQMKILRNDGVNKPNLNPNFKSVTPKKKLRLDEDPSMTVIEALSALQAGQGSGMGTTAAKKLKKFMCLVGEERKAYSDEFLKNYIRNKGKGAVSIVSWNAKTMNVIDSKDDEWVYTLNEKARNISTLVSGTGVMADLIVIQEAPGAQILNRGKKLGQGKESVRDDTLPNALKECMQECSNAVAGPERAYKYALVDVHNIVVDKQHPDGIDNGERHVFCYDENALDLKVEPHELARYEHGIKSTRLFQRSPVLSTFEVKKEGSLKGAQVIVVSVHLKAVDKHGPSRTEKEVEALARILQAYVEQNVAGDTRTLLCVLGDFNLEADQVSKLLENGGFTMTPCFNSNEPTNLWQFTGRGVREEGKQFDSAHIKSWPPASPANASGEVLNIAEVEAAHKEMMRVAQSLISALGRVAMRALGGRWKETTEDAEHPGCIEGVPNWLRNQYRKALCKIWSDHLPIKIQLSM